MGAAYKLRLHRGGATTATHAGLTPRRLRAVVATATFTILCVCAAPARGAVVKTLHLEGDVPPTGFDFFTVPFQVPTGIQEVRVHHQHIGDSSNILDWGLQDARGNAGFRGWGGGNLEPAIVGANATSRSYLLGEVMAGQWAVVVGKPRITVPPGRYNITVELADSPSLAPQTERRPYAPAAPLSVDARWYAGDFHMHSRESGDAFVTATLDEMASFARGRGLDFIHISDHNTVSAGDFVQDAQPRHPNTLIIPGVEYTTYYGHAGAIGTTRYVDHKLGMTTTPKQACDAVHRQGGLFSINHFDMYEGWAGHIVNQCVGCAWELSGDIQWTDVDAIEIAIQGWAGLGWIFSPQAIEHWDHLTALGHVHLVPIGGSDDHHGGANETKVGPWDVGSVIGNPTTMVMAANLSHGAILEGVRLGRTAVKMFGPADPMVTLTATGSGARRLRSRAVTAQVGDMMTLSSASALLVAEVTGVSANMTGNCSLVLLRNNAVEVSTTINSSSMTYNVTIVVPTAGTDRWRAEVRAGAPSVPHVITNNLYIKAGERNGVVAARYS